VRLGVVQGGLVVNVLAACGKVQALQCGRRAFPVQDRLHFFAHQCSTRRNGMRGETARTPLVDLEPSKVKRLLAFLLDTVILEHGAFTERDFAHGIGEVNSFGR